MLKEREDVEASRFLHASTRQQKKQGTSQAGGSALYSPPDSRPETMGTR